jgi:hypothetical protein
LFLFPVFHFDADLSRMVVGLNQPLNGRELSTFEYSEAGIISGEFPTFISAINLHILGILTRAIIQPLDVLKIRFQVTNQVLF